MANGIGGHPFFFDEDFDREDEPCETCAGDGAPDCAIWNKFVPGHWECPDCGAEYEIGLDDVPF